MANAKIKYCWKSDSLISATNFVFSECIKYLGTHSKAYSSVQDLIPTI